MEKENVPGNRCIICGYRKTVSELADEIPLCSWCGGRFHTVLGSFLEILQSELDSAEFIDCENNPFFSFVADLGIFGTSYHFIASMRHMLGLMVNKIAQSGQVKLDRLWRVAGLRNVRVILALLKEVGLIDIKDGSTPEDYVITMAQDELLGKIRSTAEADPELNRASTFLLGYSILRSIDKTIDLIKKQGFLSIGDGITKLYPVTRKNKVMILKGFTAPLSFVFGWWANESDEFTDLEIHRFLSNRGVTGRNVYKVEQWFTQYQPGSIHRLFTFTTVDMGGVLVTKFKYHESYQKMRERTLERLREREREL